MMDFATRTDGAAAIERAEDARYDAMIALDFAALETMIADEFRYHRASGKVSVKAEFLADLKKGSARFKSAWRYDVRVHVYGDSATVMGSTQVEFEADGRLQRNAVRYLNVWVLRDGRWQLAARQGSWLAA
jgi:ketosteroid isomerase-like protein